MHIQIGEIKYPNKKATPLAELNYHIFNSTNGVFDSYQLKTSVRMQPKLLSKYSASRYWLMEYYMLEFEQHGEARAAYGEQLQKKFCAM